KQSHPTVDLRTKISPRWAGDDTVSLIEGAREFCFDKRHVLFWRPSGIKNQRWGETNQLDLGHRLWRWAKLARAAPARCPCRKMPGHDTFHPAIDIDRLRRIREAQEFVQRRLHSSVAAAGGAKGLEVVREWHKNQGGCDSRRTLQDRAWKVRQHESGGDG